MSLKPTKAFVANPQSQEPKLQEPVTVGVPLAKLIKRKLVESPDIVMLGPTRSLGAERFRRLKTILVNRFPDSAQVLVVTSAIPGEGKTTVAVNLALAFAADKDERVLLLDGDLRRPSIGPRLQPAPQLSLSDVLARKTDLNHVILRLENSSLEVLPAVGGVADPIELISSDAARETMATLRERYQRIIIDTPPIVPFTDADALGALADGLLLVARAGLTPTPKYAQAVGSVTSCRVLGTVMNNVSTTLADWHRHSNYDYDYYYDKERKK
ncbi:MAG TPA: CpsD/CapB family tyrosine-protein kinase [Candidatus Polarisedimenticolaceae bacterium]|nr:CpsD/CapB family tyrosine-protein kinase [Candidatus Polarisedimenticolaceae bacterium]